jgi:hypothetical protein
MPMMNVSSVGASMSASDNTEPAASSLSGLRFWNLVRIAGIIVGIATLLRLATMQGLVTYDPLFQEWMNRLRDIVELGFLTDVIHLCLLKSIEWLQRLGINVPILHEVWRPTFVFSMLMLGSVARHRRTWAMAFAAPVVALVASVWSGLDNSLSPVAGIAMIAIVIVFIEASLVTIMVALCAFAFTIVLTNFSTAAMFFGVALAALIMLLYGLFGRLRGGVSATTTNASLNVGVDILGIMLGALGIASLFANPPIW